MSSLYRRNGIFWISGRENGKPYSRPLRDPDHPDFKIRDRSTAIYVKAKLDQSTLEGINIIPTMNIDCQPALESYLKFHEHRRRSKVNIISRSRIDRFLAWGNISNIGQISSSRLQEYVNERLQKVSVYEGNQVIIGVKAWLNWCVREKIIPQNPVRDMKTFKPPETTKRAFDKQVVRIILKASENPANYCDKNPTLAPASAMAVYAGLRKNELTNLEWQDIDFNRDLIFVRNKEGFTTKSSRNRSVKLNPSLKKILFKYRNGKKETGRCFDMTNFRRIWKRIAEDAGIPDLDIHELRHTFITQSLLDGIPIPLVASYAGHASWKTTQGYTHLALISKKSLQNPLQSKKA